jgi:hypothetical protein
MISRATLCCVSYRVVSYHGVLERCYACYNLEVVSVCRPLLFVCEAFVPPLFCGLPTAVPRPFTLALGIRTGIGLSLNLRSFPHTRTHNAPTRTQTPMRRGWPAWPGERESAILKLPPEGSPRVMMMTAMTRPRVARSLANVMTTSNKEGGDLAVVALTSTQRGNHPAERR